MADFDIKFDPFDPEKPTTISGKITFNKIPDSWIGKSAGELREIGADLEVAIPNCAELKRDKNGAAYFDWVTLNLTLGH